MELRDGRSPEEHRDSGSGQKLTRGTGVRPMQGFWTTLLMMDEEDGSS